MSAHRYGEGSDRPLPRARMPRGVSIEARGGRASLVVLDEVVPLSEAELRGISCEAMAAWAQVTGVGRA